MSPSSPFRVGAVLSADIAVPEHAREQRFYARVLCTGRAPLWCEDLLNADGVPIIGLGERGDAYATLPLEWMPHLQVADVAASVARAIERGGRELLHGKAEDGTSQWAVLLDPNGAAVGLIPVPAADPPAGFGGDDAPKAGHIAWLDLTVPDATATRDFYREVVGWTAQDHAMEHAGESYADYVMRDSEGASVAGICHARGPNVGLPAVWLLYLPVGDLAESLRRVREEGGKVLKESTGDDGAPTLAVIEDPVGVCLALVAG